LRVQSLPTFTWKGLAGAAVYQFQLSADRRFRSLVRSGVRKGGIETPNTAATVDTTVPDGVYYWRVRAVTSKKNAGRWSAARKLVKSWTSEPQLSTPVDTTVYWPDHPLVFSWSPVPYADKYEITVARDEKLANQVLGTKLKPITTQGTVFTPSEPLDSGTYFWTVTPIDAKGHKGHPAPEASFTSTWPSVTSTDVRDLDPDPRVFDPLFTWSPIAGAARYEVEVNSAEDFPPGSKWCCSGSTVGTSMAPTKLLANNRYYWRVRAVDVKGHAGIWNQGPSFTKAFDSTTPSIPHLTLRGADGTELGGTPETDTPIVTWDPVPGASRYEVQVVPYDGFGCDWSSIGKPSPNTSTTLETETATNAWTPLGYAGGAADHIGPSAWPKAQQTSPALPAGVAFTANATSGSTKLTEVEFEQAPRAGSIATGPGIPAGTTIVSVVGKTVTLSAAVTGSSTAATFTTTETYCLRVLARSDDDAQGEQVVSEWTQLNGTGQPAFTYGPPPAATAPEAPFVTPSSAYIQPVSGVFTPRTPYFTWRRVAGARGYFVVVARDAGFTEVVDAGFTNIPAYAPRLANEMPLSDETTDYHWVVIPSAGLTGSGVYDDTPSDNNPQAFNKSSAPPAPLSPAPGAVVSTQPTFEWGSAEGARSYQVQVSQDSSFGHPLEDVTTSATAYSSATTYPADTPLYWRVRANDWAGHGLNWSPTQTFVRTLPAPAASPSNAAGGEGIPVLGWSPVQGATGYELQIDRVDGRVAHFSFPAPAATPLEWFGVGVWRWKVRALFPGASNAQIVTGAYSPTQRFLRTLNAPAGARGVKQGGRLVISWKPDPAAKQYMVQLSNSDSFTRTIETRRTDNTSWAPEKKLTAAQRRGPLFWRVAVVDDGNNVGSFAGGSFGARHAKKHHPPKHGHSRKK
jgi:hypothetical protein